MMRRLAIAALAFVPVLVACGGSVDDAPAAQEDRSAPAPALDASSEVDAADAACRYVLPDTPKDKGPFIVCD